MKNWCIYHPKDKEVIEYLRKLKPVYNSRFTCRGACYYSLINNELLASICLPKGYTLLTEQDFKEQVMNVKKELPKYFVIKRDNSNPLWDKYIQWLNSKYNTNWQGNTWSYYGFDGTNICWHNVNSFKNNPTLLTLEEWDSIVNLKEEFVLPEKWCIRPTKEQENTVFAYFKSKNSNFVDENASSYMWYYSPERGYHAFLNGKSTAYEGYTEITFEQFKRHVLKQEMYTIEQIKEKKIVVKFNSIEEYKKLSKYFDKTENCTLSFVDFTRCSWYSHYSQYDKILRYNSNFWVNLSKYKKIEFNQVIFENMEQKEEIIGWKVKPEFEAAAITLLKPNRNYTLSTIKHGFGEGCNFTKNSGQYNFFNDLKLLDVWFEAVIKPKEEKYTLSNGKEVTITKEHVMCAGENVTIQAFKELVKYIHVTDGNPFHKWAVQITDITFKIGCWEDVKLSDIQEIIKIHDNIS